MPRGFEKKVPILQVGGPAPARPTLPVIRVVLLHTEAMDKDLCPHTVHRQGYLIRLNCCIHPPRLTPVYSSSDESATSVRVALESRARLVTTAQAGFEARMTYKTFESNEISLPFNF